VITSYGKAQRRDHHDYNSLSDPTQPLTGKNNIPLEERKDPWDHRDSGDYRDNRDLQHSRNISTVSASDVLNQPYQQPQYAYSGYAPYTDPHEPAYPTYAHTQTAAPTPVVGHYSRDDDYQLGRPSQSQAHPGESS
jgi:hypothetical protein